MPTVTITIPDEVKADIKRFSWVNWSEVSREVLVREQERTVLLERLKSIISKSKFTQKDADELSEKIKQSMHNDLKSKLLV